jgi:hypothetical protein
MGSAQVSVRVNRITWGPVLSRSGVGPGRPLLDSPGADTGVRVPFELDELDTVFTTSLVVKF